LVNEILREFGARSNIRIWKNATGVAKSLGDEGRYIAFGLKGSADILGIIKPSGRLLAIEVKTGNARQSPQQVAFERMINDFGGVYFLVRSISDLQSLNFI
jgi:hypothetical protein